MTACRFVDFIAIACSYLAKILVLVKKLSCTPGKFHFGLSILQALRVRPYLSPYAMFLLLGLAALPCQAEIHGTLTFTTHNFSRWYSKSNNGVAGQANLEYQHNAGLYLGVTASSVDFSNATYLNGAQVEITPYLGWNFSLSHQWRMDVQWSRYLYDGKVFGHDADYNEFYGFLHYKDLFTGKFAVSDDFYQLGNYALDCELTGRYPLTDKLEFSAGMGYHYTRAALGSDYPYWNIGLSYFYQPFAFDLRYIDSSETNINHALEEALHSRYDPTLVDASIVFSVSVGF